MPIDVTVATSADCAAIADLKAQVWPAEASNPDRVSAVLAAPDHVTLIARTTDHQLVGFVDGFVTKSINGALRWEVDLLAVDPTYRGQKIGQQLIAASTQAGRAAGATLARALIRVENGASQGAFRRNNYCISDPVYRLLVSAEIPTTLTTEIPYLIPVNTLNYRGFWLEGDLTATQLAAAQVERSRRGVDLVGVLIPREANTLLIAAQRLNYQPVENFQWWTLLLDK